MIRKDALALEGEWGQFLGVQQSRRKVIALGIVTEVAETPHHPHCSLLLLPREVVCSNSWEPGPNSFLNSGKPLGEPYPTVSLAHWAPGTAGLPGPIRKDSERKIWESSDRV